MATREELEQKINKLEVNMNRTDRIVNGGEDEDVLIDGGQLVPPLRKWQKEIGEEYGFPQELVQQAEDAADRAENATDRVLEVPTYTSGLEITSYNQLIRDSNGEFWRVSGQVDLPYVTTGAGIPEDDALVPAGDAALRKDLANPDKGALMVRGAVIYVDTVADLQALDTSALVDGQSIQVRDATFIYSSTQSEAADEGVVFNSGSGQFKREFTRLYPSFWASASTSDGDMLQKAINYSIGHDYPAIAFERMYDVTGYGSIFIDKPRYS